MKKKSSIHDIAKDLNVSAATVSYVLNGKGEERGISSSMIKKVMEHAEKIGYRPNMIAKSLRTGKSKIIGMLVEDIADPFFSHIARNVEQLAFQTDYKIFYASTENDVHVTRNLISAFRDAQVDAYIIAPPLGVEKDVQALIADHYPVVLFDRYFTDVDTNTVTVNNFNGAYQAISHFIENGYQHIGFVTLTSAQTQMTDRLSGYMHAVEEHDLTPYVARVAYNYSPETIVNTIVSYLMQYPQLDAVLFATNYLAIGGLEALALLKKKIPEKVAVISFDDNTGFSLFSPSVTAIAQPLQAISENIVKLLLNNLKNPQQAGQTQKIVLDAELIVRESSKQVTAAAPAVEKKKKTTTKKKP